MDTSVIYSDEVLNVLNAEYFKKLEAAYPGIQIVIKGDAEHTASTFSDMTIAIVVVILGIYMLIAAIFRSYLQPLIVLLTLPFGLIGAIWGHLLLGWTLTLFSMFGMIGLTGIVVNDAIVMIERINGNLAEGMSFVDALLTSISTVGGLTPMIFETDPYADMMIPVAITIVFGVLFATLLTLVLTPCFLMILNDLRLLASRLTNSTWESREALEPASFRQTAPLGNHQNNEPAPVPQG